MTSLPLIVGFSNDTLLTGVIFIIAAGGGVLIIKEGITDAIEKRSLQQAPIESPSAITAGSTNTSGTAQPLGTPLTEPLCDDRCLLSKWRVEQYSSDVNDADPPWKKIASGTDATPFVLEGDSGRVSVDPSEATLDFSADNVTEVARLRPNEDRSEHIQSLLEETEVSRIQKPESPQESPVHGERRFLQWTVAPGEELFVHGNAVQESESDIPSAGGQFVIQSSGRAGAIVSPEPRDAVLEKRSGAVRRTIGGVILIVGGFAGAAHVLGF